MDKWPITSLVLLRSLLPEWVTHKKLDSNQIENINQKPALRFLVWPHRPHPDCNTPSTTHQTSGQSLFPVLCLHSDKDATLSVKSLLSFQEMHSWVVSLLITWLMNEYDNYRQMEAIEQWTSSWEDSLNVEPINSVWERMGVPDQEETEQYGKYALLKKVIAVQWSYQPHGWMWTESTQKRLKLW